MDDSPGKRLSLFRNSLGLSQRDFAATLGVSHGTVGLIESDANPPSRRFLQRISERYGVSADWLLHGTGVMKQAPSGFGPDTGPRIEPVDPSRPLGGQFASDGEEYSLIRRLDLDVSAGSGLVPVTHGETERLAFSRTWLRRNHVSADLSALVRVKGDSMAPVIPEGALVLVHVAEMRVEQEGVYAFNRGDASFIKRLVPMQVRADGNPEVIAIVSDNPAYQTEFLAGGAMNEIRIVGRVRCVMVTL